MVQMVKHLPTMWETWIQFLGREDLLEKEMATRSSTLAENPMDRGAWWATIHGVAKNKPRPSVQETETHIVIRLLRVFFFNSLKNVFNLKNFICSLFICGILVP